ncbi:MAG: DUF4435 domain-containing protein [Isosphaeraceae bacterium]
MDIYVFFEGNADFSFYMPELRRQWPSGNIIPFKCKGKKNVINLIDKVQAKLDRPWRALFFVDKDLDDFLNTPLPDCEYLLQTDYYSIENHIATESMLRVIWTDIFHLHLQDPRLASVVTRYQDATSQFVTSIRAVMGAILYYRRIGHRLNLSDVNLSKMLHIDSDFCVTLREDWFGYLRSKTSGLPDPDWTMVESVKAELSGYFYKYYTRGKFDIHFFVEFVKRLALVLSEKAGDDARVIVQTQITGDNAVEVLAGHQPAPAYLAAFFDAFHHTTKGV